MSALLPLSNFMGASSALAAGLALMSSSGTEMASIARAMNWLPCILNAMWGSNRKKSIDSLPTEYRAR